MLHRSQTKRRLIRLGLTWYHKSLARYLPEDCGISRVFAPYGVAFEEAAGVRFVPAVAAEVEFESRADEVEDLAREADRVVRDDTESVAHD